ncbi:helix-turn-helix transcriptional regulator [Gordonia otitidis]|uniref:helix-turn-helix domain-containing protein n=1 Tax=Gordonia otitidis TaxID=249058 RepID=UPI001D1406F7|nr:helix-turn-helix transcriptional regulator [Gordonia otitidis]UEA60670.1 helix-turn-helix transcriptional regulator [Gordonia otitidis]
MGIFEELADEFGLGPDSAEADLAADLARADELFLTQLVALRHAAGYTQEELGRAWGRHKTAVSQFERPGADPRLSTIRRYAASIGAEYRHFVMLSPAFHDHIHAVDPRKVFLMWNPHEEADGALPEPARCEFRLIPMASSDRVTDQSGEQFCAYQ